MDNTLKAICSNNVLVEIMYFFIAGKMAKTLSLPLPSTIYVYVICIRIFWVVLKKIITGGRLENGEARHSIRLHLAPDTCRLRGRAKILNGRNYVDYDRNMCTPHITVRYNCSIAIL